MMLRLLLCLSLSLHWSVAVDTWEKYKEEFKPKFQSAEEEAFRKSEFEKTKQLLTTYTQSSSHQHLPLRVEVNRLAHWSKEERMLLKGTVVPKHIKPLQMTSQTRPRIVLPKTVDYRNATCMPPVKDQGICGSCWAFSATTALEYYNCRRMGRLAVLSEQNMVDCSTENNDCNGGFYTSAWDYVLKAQGQCRASTYQYTSGTSGLKSSCRRPLCTVGGYVRSYNAVPSNATAMAEVVAKIGPISVAVDAGQPSFDFYKSGVYQDSKCTTNVNHAVVIVGYGTTNNGIDYWIVRNSWNTWWGDNGHILIRRGVNMCGIELWPYYPVAY